MTITSFVADLSKKGVLLSRVNEQLDVRAPKGVLTPVLRDAIAQRKAEILAYLKEHVEGGSSDELPRIVPDRAHLHEPFPLTDIQQAYWIGRSGVFEQGDVSIHAYLELEAQGLDIERLDRAWQEVIARHDMLRAVVLADGQQQILEDVPRYSIAVSDHRGRPAEEVAAVLLSIREEMSHQVFSVETWPPFDVRASLLDGDRTRIHLSIDLVCLDGGSVMIVMDDLAKAYADPSGQLPALELSYRDYVLADMALRDTPLYRRCLEYWKKRATELPGPPDLPLAVSPSALKRTRFQRRSARVEPADWAQLKARCSKEGLSPSTLLLGAYAEVLAAWSRSPRFTLNLTVFYRPAFHPQIESIVGDFTSTILLGIDCSAEETFVERARRFQDQLWTDLEHRYVSGVQVLRELSRVHDGRRASMPIVFTSMVGVGSRVIGPSSAGLLGEVVFKVTQTPQVHIDFQALQREDGSLELSWDCVDELFPVGMLDDMFAAYRQLLLVDAAHEAFWREKKTRHLELPARHFEARKAANATDAPATDQVLPTLLAMRARQQPDHPAVIAPGGALTYRELHRRANHLSHRLFRLGCAKRIVAIVMDKGWEQMVAVHGIHSAAAAYLPIDPEVPAERLQYLLTNCNVKVALTQPHLDARLAWPSDVQRLYVDELDAEATDGDTPAALPRPDDLAYVIHTSGSTGLPKGVMIEHRSVVNRILDVNERFGVGASDRVLAVSRLNFDLSVYDTFGVIAAGGTIVFPEAERILDPFHWAELVVRERVTLWNSVPALVEMFVDGLEHDNGSPLPETLRLVLLAGDWIPVGLPQRIWDVAKHARVISLGGPTETTVWDICFPIESVDPAWRSIPYGRPMNNARYHVLSETLDACPTWVPGELYIGGTGLARGYWGDEEQTASKFLIHPRTGERLYKSGDTGRYRPDGVIEFLGREDLQVKIQGHRIELGEIEATLERHPAVQRAVVTVARVGPRTDRLVAYVVAHHPDTRPDTVAPHGSTELITDPIARVDFKLKRHGLRPFPPGRESLDLDRPKKDTSLLERYAIRSSHRSFEPTPLPREPLARLLSALMSIEVAGLPKYRYPSGGGLYPVQVYVQVKPGRVSGLTEGTYYYQPDEHRLIKVSTSPLLAREHHVIANRPVFDSAAFSIFMVGRMAAVAPLYGSLGRDFCLLEAGYMGQLLMTEAPSVGIGLCPLGGLEDEGLLRRALELGDDDRIVHALLGGPITETAATTLAHHDVTQRSLSEELTAFLEASLPKYMVPAVVLKDALPLTANGKVDRRSVGELALEEAAPREFVGPADELETKICAVLAEVLQLERVSTNQSFFDLGASSRDVVQIVGKLRKTLGIELRITDAFQHPTVSAFAARLRQNGAGVAAPQVGKERGEARRAARARKSGGES